MRGYDPDWSNHSSPVVGCLFMLVTLGLVVYALIGLFAGYLIIPNPKDRGEPDVLEGLAAHVGGGSLLIFYLGVYILLQDKKNIGHSARNVGSVLMSIGSLGFLLAWFVL
ncbi:MAG: hypothetical protein AAGA29_13910 [Planctomycetota bacterium]